MLDLDDGDFIFTPRRSHLDEIADNLTKEWQESGETLKSMLETLREVRTGYDVKT